MKPNKLILPLVLAFCGITQHAMAQQDDKNMIEVPASLAETEQLAWKKQLPTDGWLLLRFPEQGDRLLNLSNREYVLHLWLTCAGNSKEPPGYLVEYSDAYRDGDFGGIDFVSSHNDDGREIHFLLDGKDYGNPFAKQDQSKFTDFATALKKATKLSLSVYDNEMNPETGKDEPKLNRSIDFKMAHSALLEKPVNCGK